MVYIIYSPKYNYFLLTKFIKTIKNNGRKNSFKRSIQLT